MGGRHAVITGGSSGIGLATAHALGRRGARLSLMARRTQLLDAAVAELADAGIEATAHSVDVSDQAAVQVAMAAAVDERGPVDILVCSAGVARPGYFEQLDDDIFREMIEVDYFGTLWPIRAVVPAMIERGGGSIVGISSAAGIIGVFGYTAYGPAKFAVRGLLEALRGEMAPHGIHVGCCFPPDVDTPQLAYENQFKPAETRAISGNIKPISADQVAACIVDGIEHRRFALIPDRATKLLAVGAGLAPGVITRVTDRSVTRARGRRPSTDPGPERP
jgi:3-dehydrosphinganine reductase